VIVLFRFFNDVARHQLIEDLAHRHRRIVFDHFQDRAADRLNVGLAAPVAFY
jgi:hypothetical protein